MTDASSSLVQAVNDLWIDTKKISDYPKVLEETARFHGLSPILLDRKFQEAHGQPETVLPSKIASERREHSFRMTAKQRLRYHVRKGRNLHAPLFPRAGQRIVRNGQALFFIGVWFDQYGGYLFVQETKPSTLIIPFKDGSDLSDVFPI